MNQYTGLLIACTVATVYCGYKLQHLRVNGWIEFITGRWSQRELFQRTALAWFCFVTSACSSLFLLYLVIKQHLSV